MDARSPLIIYNDDTCSLRYVDEAHTIDALDIPLRHLAGTQVGAICWSLSSGELAYAWPSKVLENYHDKLTDEATCRKIGLNPSRDVMLTLHRQGIDYLPLLIEKAHKADLKFYGSFRMNDCHLKSAPLGLFSTRFWREHQDWRLWEITDAKSYYNAALDFSFPEVRQRRLDAIQECLEWYDLDGVELDFSREPYTFPPSEAWDKRGMLTEFIRHARELANEAGRRRGKNVSLLIRVPFDSRKLRHAGMDVESWLEEQLTETLVMCNDRNDHNQSLEPWLTRCREKNVAFYPSVEIWSAHSAAHNYNPTGTADEFVRRQRASAQNFLGQGAAGIYLFNHPCILFESFRTSDEWRVLTGILSEMGRRDTLSRKPAQYVFWQNLPLFIESGRPAKYHQTIRFKLFYPDLDSGGAQASLSFRQATEVNPHALEPHNPKKALPPGWVTYWLNGEEVPESWINRETQPAGFIASGFELAAHEKITITPPPLELKHGENTLGFSISKFPEGEDPIVLIHELLIDGEVFPVAWDLEESSEETERIGCSLATD